MKKETGMRKLLIELRKRRGNQNGFTLIEMLVVISILGILAAIVTMSMVGITSIAQSRANDTELKTVQVALDTMASDQEVTLADVCPGPPDTKQMDQFPVTAASAPPASPIALYPKYLHQRETSRKYTCDADGVVSPGS